MGTRSFVAMKNDVDGSYRAIYCHWDGYLSYQGKILLESYTNPAKINALLDEGDMSSLGPEIGEKHDFNGEHIDEHIDGVCTFYRRDRGEENVDAKTYANLAELHKGADDHGTEWLYVFEGDKWMYCPVSYQSAPNALEPLTVAACDKDGE